MPLIACHFNKVVLIYQHQMLKPNVCDSKQGIGIFHFVIMVVVEESNSSCLFFNFFLSAGYIWLGNSGAPLPEIALTKQEIKNSLVSALGQTLKYAGFKIRDSETREKYVLMYTLDIMFCSETPRLLWELTVSLLPFFLVSVPYVFLLEGQRPAQASPEEPTEMFWGLEHLCSASSA